MTATTSSRRARRAFLLAIGVAGAALLAATPARAQLRLPGLSSLSQGLRLPLPTRLPELVDQALAPLDLAGLRLSELAQRLRDSPRQLDRDPRGELIVRAELLAQPSSPQALDALLAAGFAALREDTLDGLDMRLLVLRPPAGANLQQAVERAQAIDPAGVYDYHHVYLGSGAIVPLGDAPAGASRATSVDIAWPGPGQPAARTASATPEPSGPAGPSGPPAVPTSPGALRVGLVDSGVDGTHPAFKGLTLRRFGCDDGPHPAAHGTAVASLLVGQAGAFRSALPHATLFAADAYCDAPTGGSVEAVARGLAWMAREQVAVVNVSLVGPPNQVLRAVVAQAVAGGMIVVAAVGNDGPAAPPLYPASWPGVVGVGAVDARARLLPEGARGPQVMFVAPGADMVAAASAASGFVPVRGTSFAAPFVAGLLAASHQCLAGADALEAIARLAREARAPETSAAAGGYGRGIVAESLRTPPDAVTLVRGR